jgi:transglutaminase-like putative cysteine protease
MYRPATDGPNVFHTPLLSGDTGTRQTVDAMRRLVEQGARDPYVRAAVIRHLRSSAVGDHNVDAQVRAWFSYVRDRILFVNDPTGGEWLQAARVTLDVGGGDCDDRAILLAAGLKSIGVPVQFKIVAVDPNRSATFSHVYVVANVRGRWVPLDATYQDNTVGTEPRHPYRTWMVPA